VLIQCPRNVNSEIAPAVWPVPEVPCLAAETVCMEISRRQFYQFGAGHKGCRIVDSLKRVFPLQERWSCRAVRLFPRGNHDIRHHRPRLGQTGPKGKMSARVLGSGIQQRIVKEKKWLRGLDLNQRPPGYEPDELPGCSTPRHRYYATCRSSATAPTSGAR
jgi:hypothetical protein